jgi:hypothetical protein
MLEFDDHTEGQGDGDHLTLNDLERPSTEMAPRTLVFECLRRKRRHMMEITRDESGNVTSYCPRIVERRQVIIVEDKVADHAALLKYVLLR